MMQQPDSRIPLVSAASLAADICHGDRKAFELFYRMEYDNLVHFASHYLHDRRRAEDVVQETFCTLWERHALVDPAKGLRSLVYTMARNRMLNELKSKQLFAGGNRPQPLDEALAQLEDPSLDSLIDAMQLQDLIARTWETLPEKARAYFLQSREEGLKNREIAARNGVSVKTVEYHIRTALQHFRKKLHLGMIKE